MSELDWKEDHLIDVFRVTGFFGNKPKPDVGRRFDGVRRHVRHVSKVPGMTLEEIVEGLQALERRGWLRIDPGRSTAYLTAAGHAQLSAPGFNDRGRASAPGHALIAPKDEDAMKAASVFAVAFATLTGQS